MRSLGRALLSGAVTVALAVTLLTLSGPQVSSSAAVLSMAVPSVAVPSVAGSPAAHVPTARPLPAVVGRKVVGHSRRGRPIVAWQLGEPDRPRVPRVVLISTMHGDEPATRQILRSLIEGPKIRRIDLWVVPTYNPDGLVRGTRRNARGVDLNRNYPFRWRNLDGRYESGPRPRSEPETRAMMAFLREVRPDHILSFHQPLHGVDTDTKRPAFARRVARKLRLPAKRFDCGGVCHGTMTGWYNHNFRGNALTVEYGPRPGRHLMRRVAPDQVLSIFGAWRGA